jgi:hypothetical protein
MKRYGNLWPQLVSWDNLLLAARKARRGKRDRAAVQRFEFELERSLLAIQRELVDGTYRPGGFTTHWIIRPKPRLISAAPSRITPLTGGVSVTRKVLALFLVRSQGWPNLRCEAGRVW